CAPARRAFSSGHRRRLSGHGRIWRLSFLPDGNQPGRRVGFLRRRRLNSVRMDRPMPIARLSGRAILDLAGADATAFLQNLITADIEGIGDDDVWPAALLTPQGKILFDLLISRHGEGYRIDL